MTRPTRPLARRFAHVLTTLAVLLVLDVACARAASPAPGDGVTPGARRPSAGVGGGGSAEPTPAVPADTTGPVTLAADSYHYPPGAKVGLTLTNRSDARYSFNPCNRILEQSSATGWTVVNEPGRACTMEAWILDVRGTRNATTDLPASLLEGRYRVVVELSREGTSAPAERVRAVSAPFHAGR